MASFLSCLIFALLLMTPEVIHSLPELFLEIQSVAGSAPA